MAAGVMQPPKSELTPGLTLTSGRREKLENIVFQIIPAHVGLKPRVNVVETQSALAGVPRT